MLLAAALALHDELDEAAAALAEGIRIRPQFNSRTAARLCQLGQFPLSRAAREDRRSWPASSRHAQRVTQRLQAYEDGGWDGGGI
jgi:hypothetical protein